MVIVTYQFTTSLSI